MKPLFCPFQASFKKRSLIYYKDLYLSGYTLAIHFKIDHSSMIVWLYELDYDERLLFLLIRSLDLLIYSWFA